MDEALDQAAIMEATPLEDYKPPKLNVIYRWPEQLGNHLPYLRTANQISWSCAWPMPAIMLGDWGLLEGMW